MSQKDNNSIKKIKEILPLGDRRNRFKYAIHRFPKLERGKLTFKLIKIHQTDFPNANRVQWNLYLRLPQLTKYSTYEVKYGLDLCSISEVNFDLRTDDFRH